MTPSSRTPQVMETARVPRSPPLKGHGAREDETAGTELLASIMPKPVLEDYTLGVSISTNSYRPLEPREGEPRQPNNSYEGLLGAVGAYWALLGRLGSAFHGSSGLYDYCYGPRFLR